MRSCASPNAPEREGRPQPESVSWIWSIPTSMAAFLKLNVTCFVRTALWASDVNPRWPAKSGDIVWTSTAATCQERGLMATLVSSGKAARMGITATLLSPVFLAPVAPSAALTARRHVDTQPALKALSVNARIDSTAYLPTIRVSSTVSRPSASAYPTEPS